MKTGYGSYIARHRKLSGYKSQRMLAEKSGVSCATISRIESEGQLPEASTLRLIAQVLPSTSFADLMAVCGYGDVADTVIKKTVHDWEAFGLKMEKKGITPEKLSNLLRSIEGLF